MYRIFFCLSLLTSILSADIKLASLFTDGAVLQREMKVPVWGWTKAGANITVSVNGNSVTGVANEKGEWKVELPELKAGGPYVLKVSNGSDEIALKDILVGEVWICSGQSNMDMGHRGISNFKAVIEESSKLPIRSFMVEKFVAFDKQSSLNGKWANSICSSAVGASFSYHLQKALNVPVGIIQTSWGSSSLEGWMPMELTEKLPHFKKIMSAFEQKDKQKVADLLKNCRNKANKITWKRGDNIYMRTRPNILYNAMMHPLIPYACRGVAWYQGEANARSVESMKQYKESLQTWLSYLRQVWGKDNFQFMPVMLPRFGRVLKGGSSKDAANPGAHSWAYMRESMIGITEIPGTGIANTIDLGDAKNIHPKDKLPIGYRLTQIALKNVHKRDVLSQGPALKKVAYEGAKVIISYENAKGLKTKDGKSPTAFWLAGDDRKWFKAEAKIVGSNVEVNSNEVLKPVAVRYAFAGFPQVNLLNAADLPALPFRTDKW
jgi:sialate O-acetylesterase